MNTALVLGLIFALAGIGLIGFVGFLIGNRLAREKWQRIAVAQGHARYNPETRDFEWKALPGAHTGQTED